MNCLACDTPLPEHARFCPGCARPVAGADLRRGGPGAYTPPHLADRIRAARGALEGERKHVTVLFADIADSMALISGRDPEDARLLLDAILGRMMDAVHECEGTVNQVLGDGIMALFGAPLAHEDHAVRACRAALRMQALVAEYATEALPHGPQLRIRVGLNAGEVVVRSIASDLHTEYTAVGEATHLAARMEQMAAPGTVVATREVVRLVGEFVRARPLGTLVVKGLAAPAEVWEILAANPVRTRFEASLQRGLARFVGRDAELGALQRALDDALAGRGRLVGVSGEPGVGKSRLLWEFARVATRAGARVLEATSIAQDRTTAYVPAISLLAQLLDVHDDAAHAEVAAAVERALAPLGNECQDLRAPLLALFGVPFDDARWEALDPPQRHLRIVNAAKSLVLRRTATTPLVLVVADLHWVDAETEGLLDALARALEGARLLILTEFRPEYRHRWATLPAWIPLPVVPLAEANAVSLFRSLVGTGASLAPLERLVLARVAGNPLFLEECVRGLAEAGVIEGEAGDRRLARSLDSVQIPATVHDLLASRMDRLPPEEKALLQLAAVIGTEAPRAVLERASGTSANSLARSLAGLVASGFLVETQPDAGVAYAFRHAFTHEVALGGLLATQRRALHVLALQALEYVHAGRLEDHAEALAHHALRGERWDQAVRWLRLAAQQAAARSAYRESLQLLEQALRAHAQSAGERDARVEIDLRIAMRAPLIALGQFDRIITVLRGAEAIANARGDAESRARVAVYITGHLWLVGENAAATDAGARSLELVAPLDDPALSIPARFYVAAAKHALGDYDASRAILEPLIAEVARHGDRRFGLAGLPAALGHGILALSSAELGRFDAADAEAAEALGIASRSGHAFSLITAHYVAAGARLARGDHEGALERARDGLALGRSEDVPMYYLPLLTLQAGALHRAGQRAEALRVVERILQLRREPINVASHAASAPVEVLLAAGRVDEAAALAEKNLETAKRKRERSFEAWALRAMAEVEAARTPPDLQVAEAYLLEARALARALGMRPLEARCQMDIGLLRRSRHAPAPNVLASLQGAADAFHELGMPAWRDAARRAIQPG